MHSTREAVIYVAMRLFSVKGYNATSVADILHDAGINSGSLYHHFSTKQGLLVAVLETYRDGIESMLIGPAWAGIDDPFDRIFALLGRYRELLQNTDCSYGCPIGSLALEIHEPDPEVRVLLAANFNRWTDFVESCFNTARDRLPRGVNTRQLAEFVLITMEGAVMLSRTHRTLDAFDGAVATLKDFIRHLNSAAMEKPLPKAPL